jgi:ribose transport system permease protein
MSTEATGKTARTQRPPRTEGTERSGRAGAVVNTALSRYGLVMVFIVIVTVFSILMPTTYFSSTNLSSIGNQQVVTLILALAVLTPLIVGEFDLSVAQMFGSIQLLVIGLMSMSGLHPVIAVVTGLAAGLLLGGVNALLIVRFKVSSFIATLGVATVLQGLGLWYSGGEVIFAHVPPGFLKLAQNSLFGIPLPVFYGLIIAVALWFVYKFTSVGRKFYATGGNRSAATLSGIKNGRMIAIAFVLAGALAAIASIIIASQLGSGQPLLGPSYLLPAYAGAFLGATTVTPGRFNVWGTVIAVYLLAAGVTGLQQLGVPSWVEPVFNGMSLIIAVAFSGFVARNRARKREAAKDPTRMS